VQCKSIPVIESKVPAACALLSARFLNYEVRPPPSPLDGGGGTAAGTLPISEKLTAVLGVGCKLPLIVSAADALTTDPAGRLEWSAVLWAGAVDPRKKAESEANSALGSVIGNPNVSLKYRRP
jgi:hypothetical protein